MSFKNKWLILALLVSLFVGRALLTPEHFHTHDDIQIFRLNEYIECFRDGQIPCRWSSELGKGYGYPLFVFYPPAIYAIPALISTLGLSLVTSLNLFAFLMFPLAAYSMFFLAKKLGGSDKLALLSSVAYTMIPYHALNVFVRGVYAETLAWSIFPLILGGLYSLAKESKRSYMPAVFLSLLFLTHNISTMLMYPLSVLFVLSCLLSNKKGSRLKNLKTILINLTLPFGVSAFYLFPALLEKSLVQTESMVYGYYSFVNHFVSIRQLLLDNFWGFGGSNFGVEYDEMSFMIGKPYWIAFLVVSIASFFAWLKKKSRRVDFLSVFFFLSAAVFTALTHARSTPLWQLIPNLEYIQFPWRLVGMSGFFMLTFTIYQIGKMKKKWSTSLIVLLSLLLIFRYEPFFKPDKFDSYKDEDYIEGELRRNQQQEHLFDYLPKWAHSVPDEFRDGPIYHTMKDVNIKDYEIRSNSMEVTFFNPIRQDITFPVYDYPGWKMYIEGQETDYTRHENYGFVQKELSEGEHTISMSFQETPSRKASNIVSLISLGLLAGLVLKGKNS